MAYKFEKLEVWQLALEYSDLICRLTEQLPRAEDFNLKSQLTRAATSISLSSTGQSNAEQARFLNIAIRSLVETVACQHLIRRRGYLSDPDHCVMPIASAKNCLPNYRPSVRPSAPARSVKKPNLMLPTTIRLLSPIGGQPSAVRSRPSAVRRLFRRNASRND